MDRSYVLKGMKKIAASQSAAGSKKSGKTIIVGKKEGPLDKYFCEEHGATWTYGCVECTAALRNFNETRYYYRNHRLVE